MAESLQMHPVEWRVLEVLAAVPAPEFAVVKRWLAAVESLVVVALLAADSVRLAAAKSPVTLMVPVTADGSHLSQRGKQTLAQVLAGLIERALN